jgi:hypothetical protein
MKDETMAKQDGGKHTPSDETLNMRAIAAASSAAQAGWFSGVIRDALLLAVNPFDSSEVWTFFAADNVWKRKGEEPRRYLPLTKEGTSAGE